MALFTWTDHETGERRIGTLADYMAGARREFEAFDATVALSPEADPTERIGEGYYVFISAGRGGGPP